MGVVDLVCCFAAAITGVLGIYWLIPVLQREPSLTAGWWFISAIIAIFCTLFGTGILAPFSRIRVDSQGIEYGLIFRKSIRWASVTEYRYLGLVPNMGFTARAFFRTEDGRIHFVPAADQRLQDYFNGMQNYKK